MSSIYEYLLQRRADLEDRIVEAQMKVQAPFDDELNALSLALDALQRGGLTDTGVVAEEASFAPSAKRGRKPRSTAQMVLMVLEQRGSALSVSDIAQQVARRWARQVSLANIRLELLALERAGAVRQGAYGWVRVATRAQTAPDSPTPDPLASDQDVPSLGA
jgi:hypothetical protein